LREAGLIAQREQGNRKLNTLRRDEIDERFPGLLDAVLGD
jgi:DNA-binding transcriptional ArsR family regulator